MQNHVVYRIQIDEIKFALDDAISEIRNREADTVTRRDQTMTALSEVLVEQVVALNGRSTAITEVLKVVRQLGEISAFLGLSEGQIRSR